MHLHIISLKGTVHPTYSYPNPDILFIAHLATSKNNFNQSIN
jgi:hypothetical protein